MITLKFLGQPGVPGEVTDEEKKIIEKLTNQETFDRVWIVRSWNQIVNNSTYYFCIIHERYGIVGLTGWSCMLASVTPVWWLHSEYRGKGIGKLLISPLANKMKEFHVTGIHKKIPIDIIPTENQEVNKKLSEASRKMVENLRKCFNQT